MKVKILILICFLVILIAGCSGLGGNRNGNGSENDGGTSQPALTPELSSTPVSTQPANMTNSTGNNKDKKFMGWVTVANREIMVHIQPIMVSAQNKNWTKLESDGQALRNTSKQLLSQIDDYNISNSMVEVQEKYRESLEDFEQAGSLYESAGRNNSTEELDNAFGYLKSAMEHLNNASTLLRDKFHSLHTSQMLQ